ncbi:uncharacterized protein TNCV_321001 [Trichonephila clavipes]|nr:uncharacterized protein TNCV_321001 [Trichonephila clavipes]
MRTVLICGQPRIHMQCDQMRINNNSMNVLAGTVSDFLIGLYLLLKRLSGKCYLIFLEKKLSELLQDVLMAIRNRMWFQHDEAPAHFSTDVCTCLNAAFGAQWIGLDGAVP